MNSVNPLMPGIALKIKFFIKNFFSKYEQIRRKLRIWSYLVNKSLMENLNFCAVWCPRKGQTYLNKPATFS